MSRIGKLPVAIPQDVTVTVNGQTVAIKGKKGELKLTVHPLIKVSIDADKILVTRPNDEKASKALHGTVRALLANMAKGVVEGYTKKLEVRGVGYRFQMAGKKMTLALGFSHPVEFMIPEGITITLDEENKNAMVITGADKQLVGQTAAHIRGLRVPEPYKGKGIRYLGERIVIKQGKKAAK